MPDLYHSAQLFCAETWEEIIMLADKNKEISECIVTLKELSEDERIQLECEASEKAKRNAVAREDYVFDKGVKHGLERGIFNLISTLKDLRILDAQIIDTLMEKYNLTREEAEQKL